MWLHFQKETAPVVTPGGELPWRRVAAFNPAAIEYESRIYMLERACGTLAPMVCMFGLLISEDGIHFRHAVPHPVFTAADAGYPFGSVEDPRLVRLDGRFYLTYALRRFAGNASGNGQQEILSIYADAGCDPDPDRNFTVSGIAVSDDLIHWTNLGLCRPTVTDDRDVILFPEKIGGRYVLLRRPCATPWLPGGGIYLSFADTLENGGDWSEPEPLALPNPAHNWESAKIGGATPPYRTGDGWLVLYHGVDTSGVYRTGAMLLDLEDPRRILARSVEAFLEPELDWEKLGVIYHNVVFPCGQVVRDGVLYLYYGAADTVIGLARAPLTEVVAFVREFSGEPDLHGNLAAIAAWNRCSSSRRR